MSKNNKNESARSLFMSWLLMSPAERQPKTQIELARKLGVHYTRLSIWKAEARFSEELSALTRQHSIERIGEVVHALTEKALSGNTQAIELYLKYVAGWSEKMQVQHDGAVKIAETDALLRLAESVKAMNENERLRYLENLPEAGEQPGTLAVN